MSKVGFLCIFALPFVGQPAFAQGAPPFPLQLASPTTTYKVDNER